MWGEDPEPYLTGGVNLVPLAPLTNVSENDLGVTIVLVSLFDGAGTYSSIS
jgi:hypothetical protein